MFQPVLILHLNLLTCCRHPRPLHEGHPPVPLARSAGERHQSLLIIFLRAPGWLLQLTPPRLRHQQRLRTPLVPAPFLAPAGPQVSAGRLGVIVRATLRIVRNERIRRTVRDTSVESFLETLRRAQEGYLAEGAGAREGALCTVRCALGEGCNVMLTA